jgi:hypothetical protein
LVLAGVFQTQLTQSLGGNGGEKSLDHSGEEGCGNVSGGEGFFNPN